LYFITYAAGATSSVGGGRLFERVRDDILIAPAQRMHQAIPWVPALTLDHPQHPVSEGAQTHSRSTSPAVSGRIRVRVRYSAVKSDLVIQNDIKQLPSQLAEIQDS
jgi:hypothetical protein